MTDQLSPDGQWFWNGEQWIPAPPKSTISPPVSVLNLDTQIPEYNSHNFSEPFIFPVDNRKNGIFNAKILSITGVIIILLASLSVWIFYLEDSESCSIRAITKDTDEPLGGIIDSTTIYTYSTDGYLTLEEEFSWEGTIIDRTTYTYDSDGNLIEEYRIFDSDFSRDTMTYDNDGNMLTIDTKDSYSFNDDEREIYTYDLKGNLIVKEIDVNIDGTVDERTYYEYDSNGLEFISYTDEDMDGDYDTSDTNYYDSNQRLLETKTDDGLDGSVDDIILYRYDSNGNLLEMKNDFDNDGSYEFTFSYSFDDENRPSQSIMIIDLDGTWLDSRTVTIMSYNEDGTYTSTSSTFEGSEQIRTTTTEYGCVA